MIKKLCVWLFLEHDCINILPKNIFSETNTTLYLQNMNDWAAFILKILNQYTF